MTLLHTHGILIALERSPGLAVFGHHNAHQRSSAIESFAGDPTTDVDGVDVGFEAFGLVPIIVVSRQVVNDLAVSGIVTEFQHVVSGVEGTELHAGSAHQVGQRERLTVVGQSQQAGDHIFHHLSLAGIFVSLVERRQIHDGNGIAGVVEVDQTDCIPVTGSIGSSLIHHEIEISRGGGDVLSALDVPTGQASSTLGSILLEGNLHLFGVHRGSRLGSVIGLAGARATFKTVSRIHFDDSGGISDGAEDAHQEVEILRSVHFESEASAAGQIVHNDHLIDAQIIDNVVRGVIGAVVLVHVATGIEAIGIRCVSQSAGAGRNLAVNDSGVRGQGGGPRRSGSVVLDCRDATLDEAPSVLIISSGQADILIAAVRRQGGSQRNIYHAESRTANHSGAVDTLEVQGEPIGAVRRDFNLVPAIAGAAFAVGVLGSVDKQVGEHFANVDGEGTGDGSVAAISLQAVVGGDRSAGPALRQNSTGRDRRVVRRNGERLAIGGQCIGSSTYGLHSRIELDFFERGSDEAPGAGYGVGQTHIAIACRRIHSCAIGDSLHIEAAGTNNSVRLDLFGVQGEPIGAVGGHFDLLPTITVAIRTMTSGLVLGNVKEDLFERLAEVNGDEAGSGNVGLLAFRSEGDQTAVGIDPGTGLAVGDGQTVGNGHAAGSAFERKGVLVLSRRIGSSTDRSGNGTDIIQEFAQSGSGHGPFAAAAGHANVFVAVRSVHSAGDGSVAGVPAGVMHVTESGGGGSSHVGPCGAVCGHFDLGDGLCAVGTDDRLHAEVGEYFADVQGGGGSRHFAAAIVPSEIAVVQIGAGRTHIVGKGHAIGSGRFAKAFLFGIRHVGRRGEAHSQHANQQHGRSSDGQHFAHFGFHLIILSVFSDAPPRASVL